MVRKTSLAIATAAAALATMTALESASARNRVDDGWELAVDVVEIDRVPRPNQRLPGATTSRPSNRDMRGAPSMSGRGTRGGMGGGRMNGGMGRR